MIEVCICIPLDIHGSFFCFVARTYPEQNTRSVERNPRAGVRQTYVRQLGAVSQILYKVRCRTPQSFIRTTKTVMLDFPFPISAQDVGCWHKSRAGGKIFREFAGNNREQDEPSWLGGVQTKYCSLRTAVVCSLSVECRCQPSGGCSR